MKIGVVGTGNMGRSVGILLAEQGHQVFFGARDREKAAAAASLAGASAQSGGNQEAASFGEVLIWGVRGVAASEVVPDLAAVAGKVVIDMNNNETRVDGGVGPAAGDSLGEKLQAELQGAHVVKAFNTLPMEVFEVEPAELKRRKVSVFLAADDAPAKEVVGRLAASLGFTPVDVGELRFAAMLEGIGDVIRVLIGAGISPCSSISLVELPQPQSQRLGGRSESKLK